MHAGNGESIVDDQISLRESGFDIAAREHVVNEAIGWVI